MTTTHSESGDEWSWLDGLDSVWRQRYRVAVAALVCGVVTAGTVLLLPRTYDAVATLRIGRVADKLLEDPVAVAAAINSESIGERVRAAGFQARAADEIAEGVSAVVGAQATPGPTSPTRFVTVITAGRSREEAKRLSGLITRMVLDEHRESYDRLLQRQHEYRRAVAAQVETIKTQVAELDASLRAFRARPSVEAPAVLLMRAQLEEKQSLLLGHLRTQRDLDVELTANTDPTVVIGPVSVPRSRMRPRRTMLTLAGTAAGTLLAVFWAVARDGRRRERLVEPTPER